MNKHTKKTLRGKALRSLGLPLLGALALVFAVMISACGGGSGDGPNMTVPLPGPEELPALPVGSGVTAVSSEAEALALLNAIQTSGVGNEVSSDMSDVFYAALIEITDGVRATVINDTSTGYLKISGTQEETLKNNGDSYNPHAGDTQVSNTTVDGTADFIQDKTVSGVTVLSGSTLGQKAVVSSTLKLLSLEPYSLQMSVSYDMGEGIAFTVRAGAKAAKVILSATVSFSGSVTIDEDSDASSIEELLQNSTVSGSLKLYGADNSTAVYTLNIDSYEDMETAAGYFFPDDDDEDDTGSAAVGSLLRSFNRNLSR